MATARWHTVLSVEVGDRDDQARALGHMAEQHGVTAVWGHFRHALSVSL